MAETEEKPPLHLAIIGGGVAGCAAASWAAARGARVTLFNDGLPLGGSCIHVGTFPARLLMNAASDHLHCKQPRFAGLSASNSGLDWGALNKERRAASDKLSQSQYRLLNSQPNVEIIDARAQFADPSTLEADGRRYEPDRVLLTPGSHSTWPDVEGIRDVDAISLAALKELDRQPESMIFLEFSISSVAYAQAFGRMGTKVTILTEKRRLFDEYGSPDSSDLLAEIIGDDNVDIVFGAHITHAEPTGSGVRMLGTLNGRPTHWDGEKVVVVDHRKPQVEALGLRQADIDLTDQDYIVIDEALQTTNPRVFAAGDVIGRGSHAYAAAYDAIHAAFNALSQSRMAGHNTAVPFAIYTDPQFAGVGWDEIRARKAGFQTDSATCMLDQIPAARAMGHARGFIKLIRDRRSDHLLGARIIAPNAAELIMELSLALRYGLTVDELANLVRPPVSLGEGIGRAARMLVGGRGRPV